MEAVCHHSTKNHWRINRKSTQSFRTKKGLNAGSIANGGVLSNLPITPVRSDGSEWHHPVYLALLPSTGIAPLFIHLIQTRCGERRELIQRFEDKGKIGVENGCAWRSLYKTTCMKNWVKNLDFNSNFIRGDNPVTVIKWPTHFKSDSSMAAP
jgi:hypothetical protein